MKGIAWNTVDRWLEKAAAWRRRFNDRSVNGLDVPELQADEIRTIAGGKASPTWIFTTLDVWSRLWLSAVVGRRSYRNTLALLRDSARRMSCDTTPLIVTDGFEFYEKVVGTVFGSVCLYGQVVKTRRNDRVVKVERRQLVGTRSKFEEVLSNSENSSTLNTFFVERLNLTIRQGSAYLARRSLSHARWKDRLADHIEVLRCHYNFLRPHRALKLGHAIRTPAMQVGLAKRQLTFRDVFCSPIRSWSAKMFIVVTGRHRSVSRVAA